jgi:hypothetical protein
VSGFLSISFASPIGLAVSFALAISAVVTIRVRQPAFPRLSLWLSSIGLLLLCLACGGMTWQRPTPGEVVVMVDLSPSTRGANYRDRAALDARIRQLLGSRKYRVECFAGSSPQPLPHGARLLDLAADRTVFQPPAGAAAVVLFSDGQFDLPVTAPPTYAVIDGGLESPADARVISLEIRGSDAIISASNAGDPRDINLAGFQGSSRERVETGDYILSHPLDPKAVSVSAQFAPGDLWPENDQLSLLPPPRARAERWWVGAGDPGEGWRRMPPLDLPADPPAFLAPAIIVLENVAASDLSDLQQQRLLQYVRDLGGSVLILGGDRAFAAGGYLGTGLDLLSPLASAPPEPTAHWMIVVDGSGSMAQAEGGISLWQSATDAAVRLIPHLPPDDLVSIGSFAEKLSWWSAGKSARETSIIPLPPQAVFPHGPTNLQSVLQGIAQGSDGATPGQLLLITDADVQIDDPAGLAAALRQKRIRVHLLATGNGSGMGALQIIVGGTGGTIVSQFNPARWVEASRQLLRAASPQLLSRDAIDVNFIGDLAPIKLRAELWNQVWLKQNAIALADGTAGSEHRTMAARWNWGEGRVEAVALDAPASAIEPLIASLERAPADPRFRVTWKSDAKVSIDVQARDGQNYLNAQTITLELTRGFESDGSPVKFAISQTAPGGYELSIDAPRLPAFATVRAGGAVIARFAVAGRYPLEFDRIGNDLAALSRLAQQTGGQLIRPGQKSPIDFRFPPRPVSLDSWLAILGAIFIAMALVRWQRGY